MVAVVRRSEEEVEGRREEGRSSPREQGWEGEGDTVAAAVVAGLGSSTSSPTESRGTEAMSSLSLPPSLNDLSRTATMTALTRLFFLGLSLVRSTALAPPHPL